MAASSWSSRSPVSSSSAPLSSCWLAVADGSCSSEERQALPELVNAAVNHCLTHSGGNINWITTLERERERKRKRERERERE